jgi:hypothetical protein
MATQWIIVATIAGDSAGRVAAGFRAWTVQPDPTAIDAFCIALRENGQSLQVAYYSLWLDRWSMGDFVPGLLAGRRFEATCLTAEAAIAWSDRCPNQFAENGWLAARLREAATAGDPLAQQRVLIVAREVIGPSATDDEVRSCLGTIPAWLSSMQAAV